MTGIGGQYHRNIQFETIDSKMKSEIKTRIKYVDTNYYFQYIFNQLAVYSEVGGWLVEFSPGDNSDPVANFLDHHSFDSVLVDFERWLNNLVQELEAKEFLESLKGIQSGIDIISNNQFINDEYFNNYEREKIKIELTNFQQQIRQIVKDVDHLKLIDQKIDYLIDRTKYPKIDWINLFVSNVVQLSISGVIYLASNWDFIIKLKELFTNIIKICSLVIGK